MRSTDESMDPLTELIGDADAAAEALAQAKARGEGPAEIRDIERTIGSLQRETEQMQGQASADCPPSREGIRAQVLREVAELFDQRAAAELEDEQHLSHQCFHEAALFLRAKATDKAPAAPATVDIAGTLVPIEDIAKMVAGELEGQTNLVAPSPGYLEWHLYDDATIDGGLIRLNAEVVRLGSETVTAEVTLVLRVESVTVR